jgi:hypothetical protein
MGQGVVWYTGQFYAQSFIETVCKVEFIQSRNLMLWAILMATPCFVLFGWLSDKVGRKWIMLIGMLAAVLTYRPIYKQFLSLTSAKNRIEKIDLSKTTASEPKVVIDAKDNTKIYVTQVFDTASAVSKKRQEVTKLSGDREINKEKQCQQFSSWSARVAALRLLSQRRQHLRPAHSAAEYVPVCTPPHQRSRTRLYARWLVSSFQTVLKLPLTFQAKATTSRSTQWCLSVVVV